MRVIESDLQTLKHLILDKTQGTPFFMEEVVQTLVEDGTLTGPPGHYQLTHHASTQHVLTLHIPTTVQGILAARIDRLAPEEKALLQQLAVIGRQFPVSLVKHVIAQPEAELYRLLASLQHKEFLYEQPAFPEVEYIFKHALTQEVAYGTVLQEQRKLLHERTGQALEALYGTTLHEHYSDLAHHYRRSPNTEKAIAYLQLTGQQAVQRSANTEAINHFTAALELLLTRPETPERATQELTLRVAVGPALMSAQGWGAPAVEQHYTRARALCVQLGNTPQWFPMLWCLCALYWNRGELRTAQPLAEECLQIAEHTNEVELLIPAHHIVGTISLQRGEFIRAREALVQSVARYQPQHHTLTPLFGNLNPRVFSLTRLATVLWCLGYPEQARIQMYDALRLAQEINHSSSLICALGWTAWLHRERGDGPIAQERADALMVLASDQGFSEYLAWGTIMRGTGLIVQGQWEEGVTQLRQVLETYEAENSRPKYLAWLAEGHRGAGQVDEGLAAVAEALRLVDKNDERYYEAELYRIKGTLTLQQFNVQGSKFKVNNPQSAVRNPQLKAEACFLKAIETAQRQQAKSLELRAVMSLARLWRQQGKKEEARQQLAEIYGWFTEGFDTKDLQEAKALLEELA